MSALLCDACHRPLPAEGREACPEQDDPGGPCCALVGHYLHWTQPTAPTVEARMEKWRGMNGFDRLAIVEMMRESEAESQHVAADALEALATPTEPPTAVEPDTPPPSPPDVNIPGEYIEFIDGVSDALYGGECGWERVGLKQMLADLRKRMRADTPPPSPPADVQTRARDAAHDAYAAIEQGECVGSDDDFHQHPDLVIAAMQPAIAAALQRERDAERERCAELVDEIRVAGPSTLRRLAEDIRDD